MNQWRGVYHVEKWLLDGVTFQDIYHFRFENVHLDILL